MDKVLLRCWTILVFVVMSAGGDQTCSTKHNYIRMLLMCYIIAFAINDMTQINSLLLNLAVLDNSVWILRQSPSQQNSSFRSLGIYVTSLLLVGLEQPLCWWVRRLFRPGWPVGSKGSHTATTVVSILESVYMLLWRATLCCMARSSSSS